MNEERFPPCKHCHHPAESHDEEFGNCTHLPGSYIPSNRDGCDCPGYEEPDEPFDPAKLAAVADVVLAYRPKPKSKGAKRRVRRAKKQGLMIRCGSRVYKSFSSAFKGTYYEENVDTEQIKTWLEESKRS